MYVTQPGERLRGGHSQVCKYAQGRTKKHVERGLFFFQGELALLIFGFKMPKYF